MRTLPPVLGAVAALWPSASARKSSNLLAELIRGLIPSVVNITFASQALRAEEALVSAGSPLALQDPSVRFRHRSLRPIALMALVADALKSS